MKSPAAEFLRIRKDYVKIRTAAEREIMEHVERFRVAVAQRLAVVDWNIQNLRTINTIVDRYAAELQDGATASLHERQAKAFTRGIKQVDDVLQASGVQPFLPYIPQKALEDSQVLAGKLIQKLSTEMAAKVNTEITLGLMGNQSPFQIMERLSNFIPPLKDAGNQTATAFGRAETIARTEMNRVNCAANKDRMLQVLEKYPNAQKRWRNSHKRDARPSHLAMEDVGWIPVNQDFELAGFKIFGPMDPVLPVGETANCGCTLQLNF